MTAVRYNLGFVAFNNTKDIKAMLASLEKWSPPGLHQCLMVDHSTDDLARESHQNMTQKAGWEYVAQPNLGFGAGVNRLAAMSEDQKVLVVLNLDVSFRERPRFDLMAAAIMEAGFSWVGTSMLNGSGARVAGRLPGLTWDVLTHDYQRDMDEDSADALSWQDVKVWDGAVHGGCFAVRVKDFVDVGGVDQNLFLYAEEFDLFAKFKKANKSTGFLVSSAIVHVSEGEFDPQKQLLNRYNLRYLAWREREWMLWFVFSLLLCFDLVRFSERRRMKPLWLNNMSRQTLLRELFSLQMPAQ